MPVGTARKYTFAKLETTMKLRKNKTNLEDLEYIIRRNTLSRHTFAVVPLEVSI